MMDSEVEELEIKTEIEIEEWKPPDVSGTSNQNPLLELHTFKGPMVKLELENLNDFLNTSKGPMIKLEGMYF